ncbi:MAG: MFS transporter, partial [Pseudomonadota bacterium]|nr:MFS transporter [Pseudomonadota bacterium]
MPPTVVARQAAMPFIMITVLIDMMSIGLIVPVLPALVGTFASDVAQAWGFAAAAFAFSFANFLASPVIGALSDRYGRRPVLLVGFSALATSFFLIGLVTSLSMLILVRLFGGAMQSNLSVANAYVADTTAPADRARRFG